MTLETRRRRIATGWLRPFVLSNIVIALQVAGGRVR